MQASIARRRVLPALLLTVAFVAAACGSNSSGSEVASLATSGPAAASAAPSTGPVDFQESLLKYTQCLRDNGLDVPDPQFGADGRPQFGAGAGGAGGRFGDIDLDSPEFQAAQEACGDILAGVQRQIDPEVLAERQAQLLVFAECMRDEGIDFPDPQLGTDGGPRFGAGRFGGLDFQSPEFQTAFEVCQDSLGGFGPGGRNGPGGQDGAAGSPQ